MNRPIHVWLIFGGALALALAAMVWISVTALELDRAEVQARAQAQLEEDVRLALWRMDSYLATIVAQESGRPHFTYSAFYPLQEAFNNPGNNDSNKATDVWMPSPLLTNPSQHAVLNFQCGPDGQITSPQSPPESMQSLLDPQYAKSQQLASASEQLQHLRDLISFESLADKVPRDLTQQQTIASVNDPFQQQTQSPADLPQEDFPQQGAQPNAPPQQPNAPAELRGQQLQQGGQRAKNTLEFRARQQSYQQIEVQNRFNNYSLGLPSQGIDAGVMRPVWLGKELVLARWVSKQDQQYLQGVWLNWPSLKGTLQQSISDLFPLADLRPAADSAEAGLERKLAVLPVEFLPGESPRLFENFWSPIRIALTVGWLCLLLAAVAVALLLAGVVRLSERRASFVSAVTHELRTPLTTFRMYAEMLADEMVVDPVRRRSYLETLRGEAQRLTHLVENVLAYARLERKSTIARMRNVPAEELLALARGRFEDRARTAGMTLSVQSLPEDARLLAYTDPAAVEQILFNLVDNACKYARPAEPAEIHIQASAQGGRLYLNVRDHGPGICQRDRGRLFQAFSKSAQEAAHSAPGVGLGLALSRRLAREMQGDLRLIDVEDSGACFRLVLPLAKG